MAKPRTGRTLATSPKTRAAHQERRAGGMPLQIDKNVVGKPVMVTIQPDQFHLLHVDYAYQREIKQYEVNDLIHILKNGGYIPEQIVVVLRADKTYWVIDGHQRFEAHRQCEMPVDALLYNFNNRKEEAKLFLVLNRAVRVSSESIVQAWQGPSATLLRKHAATSGSPYFSHVNFGRKEHGSRPYSAVIVLRGLAACLAPTPSRATGATQNMLERLDLLMQEPGAEQRTEAYFKLLPLVFPPPKTLRYLPTLGLGAVAHERWEVTVDFPSPVIYTRLARIDWGRLVPNAALRFLSVVREEIGRHWRPSKFPKQEA